MAEQNPELDKRKETRFMVNREVRYVPLHWEHPKDKEGQYIPLMNRAHPYDKEEIAELIAEGHSREEIESSFMPDFSQIPEEKLGISAYETTTEGTPISPVFPNTPEGRFELVKYCTENSSTFGDHKTGEEAWSAILFGRGAAFDPKERRIEARLDPPRKT